MRKRILRSPLLAVLLLVLVLRAAIPFGYMPVAAPDGSVHMDICPDHVPPAPDTTSNQDDSHGGATQCPFELSASPPLLAVQVFVAVEPPVLLESRGLDRDSKIPFTPARIQRARAPPVSRLIQS